MYRLMHVALTAAALVIALSAEVVAQNKSAREKDASVASQPGYVDFSSLDRLGQEAKVEVNLRAPMLGLVGKLVADEDPELRDLVSGLKLVRVRVYDMTAATRERLMAVRSETSAMLDKAGWERIVRVRDQGEHVDVYFKPSGNAEWIDGVLVMALGDDDEAAFVNIVGTIRPEDAARIGEHMSIDGMHRVRVENKIKN